ncbi:RIC1-domain-containing protein [Eremomyces bilateralis CBS 781.70]|uniref:RIC1-domain-containing protein n=1 Tax=Eremomyces bilateralis CBS 781.70 TaxID=1392243 RepID=A0A6G1GGN7_9PEZI|nr:RIC1-domain-containing protein [Eremomyces bilateralis CBS 781.70]KAF1817096.1 RIC1-domain-containing protein [Eremomyces bilateralis CBS 781.70]
MYWPIGAPQIYSLEKQALHNRNAILYDENDTFAIEDDDGEASDSRNDSVADQSENERAGLTTAPHSQRDHARNRNIQGEGRATHLNQEGEPVTVLTTAIRSQSSLRDHGTNIGLSIRPDSSLFVVQTSNNYLIIYSFTVVPGNRVYRAVFVDNARHSHHGRRYSAGQRSYFGQEPLGEGEDAVIAEAMLRFRATIRIDSKIGRVLALDDGLVVATKGPGAVQVIRWGGEARKASNVRKGSETSRSQETKHLLSQLPWISGQDVHMVDMVYDRPMNLSSWVTSDGRVYAVQTRKRPPQASQAPTSPVDNSNAEETDPPFRGFCFHMPTDASSAATMTAINARFSLLAVGCANGDIYIYSVKDYSGNIPLSHRFSASQLSSSAGELTFLSYSPDGYCLFAGMNHAWSTWSVYGKLCSSSMLADRALSSAHSERWLLGVRSAIWLGGGSQIAMVDGNDKAVWVVEMARSAVTGCFSPANIARSLLQTNAGFVLYRGHELPNPMNASSQSAVWQHVQVPPAYLMTQWPIRSAVVSPDGRYVAVAGKRGLAHYSVQSGRWKTFESEWMENEFTVRGGMCWFQHVLVAAVESNESFELRIYSRELPLHSDRVMYSEALSSPIVLIAPSGEDSLLVYTYENILCHYVVTLAEKSIKLVQVGQIALHGIIRAPPRVRALSWVLPEDQLESGDPSQDVSKASVMFLVDGKLVLLQPTTTENSELKYEMRIIAQNVEHYALMRDHRIALTRPPTTASLNQVEEDEDHVLQDSLWYFDGTKMRVWTDVQETLSAPVEAGRDIQVPLDMSCDFYPLSVLLRQGLILGIESEMVQRRDLSFASARFATRTHLFLPTILRSHLARFDSPAALHLSHFYQHFEYFAHALEVLLHDVLDDEVDASHTPEATLLPGLLSFLSTFPQYLDIVVQCTRKTEVRSWKTLFAHLPPPQELFEESLAKGSLKTAGGYLLVLHTIDELNPGSSQIVRLLRRAKVERDWELCKELARFLMALDESGDTLRSALSDVELRPPPDKKSGGFRALTSSRENSVGFSIGSNASPSTAL